ncbi:MAG: NAD(P)/FAD-dependent oxidoreductase [Promethearchaeota archaeon]
MPEYDYLIVGGGIAADSAAKGIREVDPGGSIGLLTRETVPPYNRYQLIKDLWLNDSLNGIWCHTSEYNVDVLLNKNVVEVKPFEHVIVDAIGVSYKYKKLLLATGMKQKHFERDLDEIIYYYNIDDFERVKFSSDKIQDVLVIGGGRIGAELSARLAQSGMHVTLAFKEEGIGGDFLPRTISRGLVNYYESRGIRVLTRDSVVNIEKSGDLLIANFLSGEQFSFGMVIARIGVEPFDDLARSSGLAVDNGILVTKRLVTSDPDIYAAGDVALVSDNGNRIGCSTHDNAKIMGKIAGVNMAGGDAVYEYVPSYHADIFDNHYEVVGDVGVRYDYIIDWEEESERAIIYFVKYGKMKGVLFWNTRSKVDLARDLIGKNTVYSSQNVIGLIPFD